MTQFHIIKWRRSVMKMHHKLKQCIICEKRCIRVDYLVTEEHPSEFCFEVILYHPDGSEEREEIP